MSWWYNQNDTRQFEDKNVMNAQLNDRENRLADNKSINVRNSTLIILKGVVSAIVLTAFEYANKNPEVTGILKTIFTIGYFVSALLTLQLPYGVYQLTKRIFIKMTNKEK